MSIKQTQPQSQVHHHSEEILVVQQKKLFLNQTPWHGINTQVFNDFIQKIEANGAYIPRAHAETNPHYKQIIPYLIYTFNNKLFVMQRKSTASEQRLANKYSLGIGGHIRKEDISNNDIFTWSKREFDEEVSYKGSLKVTNLGVLNDDTTEVGKVHLGMVLLVEGESENITIKDEHKSGKLLSFDECYALYDRMETWSQLILKLLQK